MPTTTQNGILKSFGMVDYYLNMWSSISHILQPLSRLTSNKIKFKWIGIK